MQTTEINICEKRRKYLYYSREKKIFSHDPFYLFVPQRKQLKINGEYFKSTIT